MQGEVCRYSRGEGSRMYQEVVVIFCGPHEKGRVSFRRIDAAINAALEFGLPLLIAGDGNKGLDVVAFEMRARERGVSVVVPLYDAQANTLTDARLVCEFLRQRTGYEMVQTVHLVTDYWHMPRASLMLSMLLREQSVDRCVVLNCVHVQTPPPSQSVLDAERQGIEDFMQGRYEPDSSPVQFGKPAHPASVEFVYPGHSAEA